MTARVRIPLLLLVVAILLARAGADERPAPGADDDGTFNVRSFGARGDGVADDTAAIRAAIDAAPAGGVIHFPPGRYLVSGPLSIGKDLGLRGACGNVVGLDRFGGARWTAAAGTGSVLVSTAKDGAVIDCSARPLVRLVVEDLVLVGVGDASRTTVGIRVGDRASPSGWIARIRGVRACNFAVGVEWSFVENSAMDDCWMLGCGVGLSLLRDSSANTFSNVSASYGRVGFALDASTSNAFTGGAVQGHSEAGVVLAGHSDGNAFRTVYFENTELSGWAVDARSADFTVLDGCMFSKADDVRIAARGCRLHEAKYTGGLTITPGASYTEVHGDWSRYEDAGVATRHFGIRGAPTPKRAQGQALIPPRARSVTVEHGLGAEPRLEDVGVKAVLAPVRLSGSNSRTLIFKIDAPAPAGGVDFKWSATLRVNP